MEKVWLCNCQIAHGDREEHDEKFKSYRKVKEYVRKKITEHIDASALVGDLKGSRGTSYTRAIAEFLTKYVEDPNFPYSEKDLPSDSPYDYDEPDDGDDDDAFDDCDELGDITFYLSSGELYYKYNGHELLSHFILDEPNDNGGEDDKLKFSYLCDCDSVINMEFSVNHKIEWGSSAKPIMVLRVLEKATRPMLIADIISEIWQEYEIEIERKSVGRHIELLNELGYNIQKSRKGFVLIRDEG